MRLSVGYTLGCVLCLALVRQDVLGNIAAQTLYAGQEATDRTRHGTTDWFQTGKGVCESYLLSPCLFNLYAEYIMWNARLDKAQAGIKTAGRSINNLRYADGTTLMAESKEELKPLDESERGVKKLT